MPRSASAGALSLCRVRVADLRDKVMQTTEHDASRCIWSHLAIDLLALTLESAQCSRKHLTDHLVPSVDRSGALCRLQPGTHERDLTIQDGHLDLTSGVCEFAPLDEQRSEAQSYFSRFVQDT